VRLIRQQVESIPLVEGYSRLVLGVEKDSRRRNPRVILIASRETIQEKTFSQSYPLMFFIDSESSD